MRAFAWPAVLVTWLAPNRMARADTNGAATLPDNVVSAVLVCVRV